MTCANWRIWKKESAMCKLADMEEAKCHVLFGGYGGSKVSCANWRIWMKQSDMCYLADMEEAKCHVQIGGY